MVQDVLKWFPISLSYLSRQLCQLEFKTPRPSGRSGSTQRGQNDLWDLKPWQLSDRISFAKSGLCLITAKKYPWCDLTFYGLFHLQFPALISLSLPLLHSWWASMQITIGLPLLSFQHNQHLSSWFCHKKKCLFKYKNIVLIGFFSLN